MNTLQKIWFDDTSQDIAEYAVMLAVLLIVTLVTIRAIGANADHLFSRLADMLGSVS